MCYRKSIQGKKGKEVTGDDVIITCETIRKKHQSIKIPNNVTIFKVPSQLDSRYVNACRPRHISIGPYHRGKPELKAMEVHKLDYLQMFLERIEPELQLEDLVSKITEMEVRARSCYSDPISMGKNDFIEMMLLDGCFIIEFMLKLQSRENGDQIVPPNPPILSTRWKWLLVLTDLLALENQLPFSVLQCLYNLVHTDEKLIEKLFNLFKLSTTELFTKLEKLLEEREVMRKISEQNPHHLLHLVQIALSQGVSVRPDVKEQLVGTRLYRPAVELDLSGVKFKTKNAGSTILDVTFSKGFLEMTHLTIDEHSAAFLRNFVALEQCSREYGMHFSSYIRFMSGLVDSKEDVELLVKKGIISNSMGSNDDIVNDFFKPIFNDVVVNHTENHLGAVLSEICEYCKPSWRYFCRKSKVKLLKDYFGSPWSILSFLAAVLLVAGTILQSSVVIDHYVNHRP